MKTGPITEATGATCPHKFKITFVGDPMLKAVNSPVVTTGTLASASLACAAQAPCISFNPATVTSASYLAVNGSRAVLPGALATNVGPVAFTASTSLLATE